MYSKGNKYFLSKRQADVHMTWLALTLLYLEIHDISKVELKQQITFSSLIFAQNKPKWYSVDSPLPLVLLEENSCLLLPLEKNGLGVSNW